MTQDKEANGLPSVLLYSELTSKHTRYFKLVIYILFLNYLH